MHLIQFIENSLPSVGVSHANGTVHCLKTQTSLSALLLDAIKNKISLKKTIEQNLGNTVINYNDLYEENRILPPLTHTDPAHVIISGTGLTHLNSTLAREEMYHHDQQSLSAAQQIYLQGLKHGKSDDLKEGVRPEWFYKGNGHLIRTTNNTLEIPNYAQNVGEEAELVAVYFIGPDSIPRRIGFALGNELSDHGLEKENVYYLAQSKLFNCAIGPEIYIDDFPKQVGGKIEISNRDKIIWESAFKTGGEQIVHSLQNLERHLFQSSIFRIPGDIHYYFLGADKISFSDEIQLRDGYSVKISANMFNHPLINKISKKTTKLCSTKNI